VPVLTLAQYFGEHERKYGGELTLEKRANAAVTVDKTNKLLAIRSLPHYGVASGWRPAAYNASVPNAAKKSKHITCQAIDLRDPDGSIDAWCTANTHILVEIGLWLEHPDATPGWCHVQTIPPKSGNRIFRPK